jgi:hypothetical protein
MMNRVSKRTLLTLGASGVLALGIAVPTMAFASDRAGHGAGRTGVSADARQQKLAEGLAKELGIDQAKVADALQKVEAQLRAQRPTNPAPTNEDRQEQLKTRLAEAVKAGKITQAEADAILKAAQAGVLSPHPSPRG